MRYCDTVGRGHVWTDERVALVKKRWAEGLSASQIAGELGGVSRNAVISKLHRLGCSGRTVAARSAASIRVARSSPPKKPRVVAESSAPKRKAAVRFKPPAELAGVAELVIPAEERKVIDTLESCHCRWPIGDPQHASFHFCGRKKLGTLPYCEFHCSKAFQPRSGPKAPVVDLGWNHRRVLQVAAITKVA